VESHEHDHSKCLEIAKYERMADALVDEAEGLRAQKLKSDLLKAAVRYRDKAAKLRSEA
jgi:hypothetical protein